MLLEFQGEPKTKVSRVRRWLPFSYVKNEKLNLVLENFRIFEFKVFPTTVLISYLISLPIERAYKNMFSISSLARLHFILSRFKTRLVVIGFQDVGRHLLVMDDLSCNQLLHYFVGTTIDCLNSGIHISFCNWVLPHVSPTSMELDTVISHTVL